MSIIRKRAIQADHWRPAADGEPLPDGDVIVSLARWQAEAPALRVRSGRVGVRLGAGETPDALLPDLDAIALVAFEFASFGDGRPYSHARQLRERHGFGGEIRAVGDVFRDQLPFLERCGFDSFELRAGEDAQEALAAFESISVRFQPAADGPASPRPANGDAEEVNA